MGGGHKAAGRLAGPGDVLCVPMRTAGAKITRNFPVEGKRHPWLGSNNRRRDGSGNRESRRDKASCYRLSDDGVRGRCREGGWESARERLKGRDIIIEVINEPENLNE